MKTKATKPYAKSHLSMVIVDPATGEHMNKVVRIAGHPYSASAIERASAAMVKTLKNGNKILTSALILISEDLKEQSSKVFQPAFLEQLKAA